MLSWHTNVNGLNRLNNNLFFYQVILLDLEQGNVLLLLSDSLRNSALRVLFLFFCSSLNFIWLIKFYILGTTHFSSCLSLIIIVWLRFGDDDVLH